MWDELKKDLTIVAPLEGAGRRAAPAALDRFEKKYGFKLPASYRAFVETFGPGELGRYFRIHAPGYPGREIDLGEYVEGMRQSADMFAEIYGDADLVARMVPFGDTIGGDVIAWDPRALTPKTADEYPIVFLPRDQQKVRPMAPTFPQMVADVCLDKSFGKLVNDPNYEVVREFQPYARPA